MFDLNVNFHVIPSGEGLATPGAAVHLWLVDKRMVPSVADRFAANIARVQEGRGTQASEHPVIIWRGAFSNRSAA